MSHMLAHAALPEHSWHGREVHGLTAAKAHPQDSVRGCPAEVWVAAALRDAAQAGVCL